jgi:hypothetical protein
MPGGFGITYFPPWETPRNWPSPMGPVDLLDFPHPVINIPSDNNPIMYRKLPFIFIA